MDKRTDDALYVIAVCAGAALIIFAGCIGLALCLYVMGVKV